jgi:hypothetical protein
MEPVPEDLGGEVEPTLPATIKTQLARLAQRVEALEGALETLDAGPTMERGGPAVLRRKMRQQRQAIAKAMAKPQEPAD